MTNDEKELFKEVSLDNNVQRELFDRALSKYEFDNCIEEFDLFTDILKCLDEENFDFNSDLDTFDFVIDSIHKYGYQNVILCKKSSTVNDYLLNRKCPLKLVMFGGDEKFTILILMRK